MPELTVEQINAAVTAAYPGSMDGRCVEAGPAEVLVRRDVDPGTLRPGGYVSGPSQFGIADMALWFLAFAARDRIELMAMTSELSIRYLRPAVGSTLWARASLDRAGRRNMVGTVRIWTDDETRPTSTAQGTYAYPLD